MSLFSRNILRVTVALFALCSSRSAFADLIIDFSVDGGATFISSFETNVGATSTFEVFIREVGVENRLSTIGLVETGTRATFNTGRGQVLSISIPQDRLAPRSNFSNASGSGFVLMESAFDQPGRGSSVKLGEFVFLASQQGATEFRFGDANRLLTFSNFTLATVPAGFDLDPELFGGDRGRTYNLTITAVPEPSLVSLLPCALYLWTFRRRVRYGL